MIRIAKPADVGSLISVGREVQTRYLKFLRPDNDRMKSLITECISSAQHLAIVSVNSSGEVVGGAVVITQPFAYAEKLHSQIVALYTEESGDGVAMLDHILKWFNSRKASLLLCYAAPASTRLDRLLLAKRFKREGTMLVRRRYNGISK